MGYDINCGVRLIRTNLSEEDVLPVKEELAQALYDHIPVGVGSKGIIPITNESLVDAMVPAASSSHLVVGHGLVSARRLQLERGQGALRGVRPNAECRRCEGVHSRSETRSAPAWHLGRWKSLRRDPGGRRDLRCGSGEEDGDRSLWTGGRHDPLWKPGIGTSGGVGRSCGHGARDGALRHRGERQTAGMRTHPVTRGTGLSKRNGGCSELRVGEPVCADVPHSTGV